MRFLIDTNTIEYAFINRSLITRIYKLLGIEPIPLIKSKRVRGYDKQIAKRPITMALYPNLVLPGHTELTTLILITNLSQYAAILDKP